MRLGLGGAVTGCSMTLEAAFIPQIQQMGSESQPLCSALLFSGCLGLVVAGGGKDRGQKEDVVERVGGS